MLARHILHRGDTVSYQIFYGKTRNVRTSNQIGRTYKRLIIWGVALLSAISICWIGWSNSEIRQYLLPGDPQITEAALDQLILDVQNGEPFSEAITTFCKGIIENALVE